MQDCLKEASGSLGPFGLLIKAEMVGAHLGFVSIEARNRDPENPWKVPVWGFRKIGGPMVRFIVHCRYISGPLFMETIIYP